MRVETAQHAGFCFGVERAVSLVEALLKEGTSPLYTYGPIIHNEEVIQNLKSRGVTVIEDLEKLGDYAPGTLVIRSHGISRREQELLEAAGFKLVDATCPFVKKIHHLAEEAEEAGRTVFVIGDPDHSEVKAILGWCRNEAYVIRDEGDIPDLDPAQPISVLTQTTHQPAKFQEMLAKIKNRYYNAIAVNTICNATQIRQQETRELAQAADAMIVIGGLSSSNTRKLVEICEAHCSKTYYIRTLKDLQDQGFQPVRYVGITAGASTPKNIIEEVQNFVGSKF